MSGENFSNTVGSERGAEIFGGADRAPRHPRPQMTIKEAARETAVFAETDVLVVGGGPAGTAAAVEDRLAVHGTASNAVLFGHASPTKSAYATFETGFLTVAQDFDKPILYLQGDSHTWALGTPWSEAPNITKVIVNKTNGSNDPLQVFVDNDPNDPFDSDHSFGGEYF